MQSGHERVILIYIYIYINLVEGIQTHSGTHRVTYAMGTAATSLRSKHMGHATDKKQWSCTSTHVSGLMECTIATSPLLWEEAWSMLKDQ